MESWTFESNVNNLYLTNRPNRSNRRKVKGPFSNSTSLMRCSNPMASWTIKSHVSFLHLANRSSRSNRRNVVGPFYNYISRNWNAALQWKAGLFKSHIQFHHLTNRTKRSNVYDPFSNGVYLIVLDNPLNFFGRGWSGNFKASFWGVKMSESIFFLRIPFCTL